MGDIFIACRVDNLKRVEHLIEVEGMSPNMTKHPQGITPLHTCALWNSVGCARFLISKGAKVTTRCAWGWFSPLHFSYKRGHLEVSALLLRAGASRTIRDKSLRTPAELGYDAGLATEVIRIEAAAKKIMEERRGIKPS